MGVELKKERRDNIKYTEEKFKLKNDVFYGSYYQDQKYKEKPQVSRAYKTYMKGLKDNVNRKTTEVALKRKQNFLYGDTKIY